MLTEGEQVSNYYNFFSLKHFHSVLACNNKAYFHETLYTTACHSLISAVTQMPLTAVSGWHWPAADSRQEAAVAQGEKAGNSFFGRSSFEDDIPPQ